jgi:hypothetical protein
MSGHEEHTYRYDPELPFLYELEREVRRHSERAARARGDSNVGMVSPTAKQSSARSHPASSARRHSHATGHTPHAPAPLHARRTRGLLPPMPMRVARRSLTLVVLLCLIGVSAYGASQVFSSGTSNPTVVHQSTFVLVAAGHAGSDAWSLRLYTRGGDLCRVLVAAENESSRCAPSPGPRALGVTSLVSPLRQYVYGITGGEIARVVVRTGGATATVTTHAPDSARARGAGLPASTRWFIAVLPRPAGDADPPALAQGLNTAGHATGPVRVACAQTAQSQACPS